MIRSIPFACLTISGEGTILAANQQAEDLLGRDMVGQPYQLRLRQPEIVAAVVRCLTTSARALVSVSGESQFQVHVEPMAQRGALILWQDVSEVEELSRMRRDFVANVSHELRSPLTSLIGFIETLTGPAGEDPAARRRFLDIMGREAHRMNRLIADLLSLSSVESNEKVRPRDSVLLADLVRSVAIRLKPQAGEDRLILNLDPDLIVLGEGDQLGQALSNLVENALRYGKENAPVRIDLARVEDAILMGPAAALSVRDQGEGIPMHHIPRLTERFYRVDNHRSRDLGGTGLGLAIVKHIVQRHRGRLKIESRLGEGSTFTILLPLS